MNRLSTCWILTNGMAGMESQARGLAQALGVDPLLKRIRPKRLWAALVPRPLWVVRPFAALDPSSDPLEPPWPDLVISCGQTSGAFALGIRTASGGRTRIVHVHAPGFDARHIDLVIAPRHDRLNGDNVVVTRGALHPVTPARLAAAAAAWAERLAHLRRPLVAVLVGGPNGRYRMPTEVVERLGDGLARVAREHGAGIAVTPSRRTPPACVAVLRRRLERTGAYVWDGSGDNPYLGMLGLADTVVVTEDSVSMISEAIATAKPVYVARLVGGSRRLDRFTRDLVDEGIVRTFDGTLATWRYDPPDDTARAAAEVRRRFGWPARRPVETGAGTD